MARVRNVPAGGAYRIRTGDTCLEGRCVTADTNAPYAAWLPFPGGWAFPHGQLKVKRLGGRPSRLMPDRNWRAEQDSNLLPPAVLQVCFRKHLPPVSPPQGGGES